MSIQEKSKAFYQKEESTKRAWDAIFSKLVSAHSSADNERYLTELTSFLVSVEDLPAGLTKSDIVQAVQPKKYVVTSRKRVAPQWTVEEEMAYRDLIATFTRKITP